MSDAPKITYPDVTVQLTGQDGNAFNIIGLVREAIRDEERRNGGQGLDHGRHDVRLLRRVAFPGTDNRPCDLARSPAGTSEQTGRARSGHSGQ